MASAFLHNLGRAIFRHVIFPPLGGIARVHPEREPKEGALIVAPLHVSHLDPPAVGSALRRPLCYMAKEELFKGPFGRVLRGVRAYPVRRGEGDTGAIRLFLELLAQGEAVLLFPEGTRGDGRTIQPLTHGVAMLAKKSGAKVLPIGVVGSHRTWPRGVSRPKRHRIEVVFGEPFTYAEVAGEGTEREKRERFTQTLSDRIVALCNERGMGLKSAAYNPDSSEPNDR